MITTLPAAWQLLDLFESEPRLADPEAPWEYNRITCESTRGADGIVVAIEPAYERAEIRWWQGREVRLHLDLMSVASIRVESAGDHDALLLDFHAGGALVLPLRLQLRPFVAVQWGIAAAS